MRWIDELNGDIDTETQAISIKKAIRAVKKEPTSPETRKTIKRLYADLDGVQFKPDYLSLVIDTVNDYRRACKGFTINGIRYVRLLGTNGGVKTSTIVFVSDRIADELRKRITNGRNEDVKMIPAKYEAYRALACSASTPVSMPNGILVVTDCETTFHEDVIYLSDENVDEPIMTFKKNEEIVLDESDGYGIMLPSLAERWSKELGLDYVAAGVNTRCAFEKGMVFAFDFIKFADEVSGKYIVKDAWGNDVDIRSIELILTTSMLKLWDCYSGIDDYLEKCAENKYMFGITKTTPQVLDSERSLNYQFIQSFHLSDDQITKLIAPTVHRFNDTISDDYMTAILFTKGANLTERTVDYVTDDFFKAIMIDKRMFNDPFIRRKLYQLIRKRINDAKIGVIQTHGNYSIVSGDPYALCQHIFDMPVTGLLHKGEIYSKYWLDAGVSEVLCFRAPMTCHNNIRKMHIADSEQVRYWYKHMNACTLFNAWDTAAFALNGMDKDGDLTFVTDNSVLLEAFEQQPTIMCVQRKASKVDINEKLLVKSNIDSFGDDIGKTTNWITSMFDVQSSFLPDSKEYAILDYRIKCGQLYQQNAIDKAKGIISKPMPSRWYDRHAVSSADEHNSEKRLLDLRILADKKPYFMRYIYPALMSEYQTYIKNTDKKCLREFRIPMTALLAKPASELTQQEAEFISRYHYKMPVGDHGCVMNKICKRFEKIFDSYFAKDEREQPFDYSIMKSNTPYSESQRYAIMRLYEQYIDLVYNYLGEKTLTRISDEDAAARHIIVTDNFKRECASVCTNSKQLCDIILDLCYKYNYSKRFCWDMCASDIIDNLLNNNGRMIVYPEKDPAGDIEYNGERFTVKTKEV